MIVLDYYITEQGIFLQPTHVALLITLLLLAILLDKEMFVTFLVLATALWFISTNSTWAIDFTLGGLVWVSCYHPADAGWPFLLLLIFCGHLVCTGGSVMLAILASLVYKFYTP